MKKLVLVLTALAMGLVVGCSKDKKDDNNSRYNDPYYSGIGGAGLGYYQWQGNSFVDMRNGRTVAQRYCTASGGLGYNGLGYNGNAWQGNYAWQTGFNSNCAFGYVAMPLDGFGRVICVQSSFTNYVTSNFGQPYVGPQYSGFPLVGCIPGYSSCACNQVGASFNFGVHLGANYAGLNAGVCFR